MFRVVIAFLVLAGFLTPSLAQDLKKEEEPKKQELKKEDVKKQGPVPNKDSPANGDAPAKGGAVPVPGEVDVHFLNGSNVRMLVRSEKLEITTVYGKLAVPIKDVRAIEFGVHFPEGMEAKIESALRSLGDSSYREREKASKTLTELGPYSYPAVYQASQGKDLESSRRAKEIVKKLQAIHPKKDLKTSEEDKLVTPTFTIVGRILTPSIQAKTEYFGDVVLSLAKMRTLRAITGPSQQIEVSVDAAKYANAGQWLETSFQVDGKTALVITAKGVVDTWPQGPGQYLVTPNGQAGRGFGGAMVIGGGRIVGGPVIGQMHGGMLFGKIGANGDIFVIGERYDSTPESEGKLYLHIGPSPWNCQSTGAYEVKIGRKD